MSKSKIIRDYPADYVMYDAPTTEEARKAGDWMSKPLIIKCKKGPRPPWMYPKDHPLYRPKEEK